MQFFTSAIQTLQTLVVALGAGLGVWGVVNLLEGYGSDTLGQSVPNLMGWAVVDARPFLHGGGEAHGGNFYQIPQAGRKADSPAKPEGSL